MTLSSADREALASRSSLTPTEEFLISNAVDHLHANAKRLNHNVAVDDRCAALEAAMVRYMIASRPSIPSVPVEYKTANYTVEYDPSKLRGSFEHNTRGECSAGSLLFDTDEEGKTRLLDYDGVTQLPKEVLHCLKNQGFVVDGIDEDYP
jgi:hypothetical protein